ncbi:hypothetical protein [Oxynema aestuarii]|jgi:uncharacterized RDD family membrane protein YckC|nr:hypothetical protein [Oxynema aestuarii]
MMKWEYEFGEELARTCPFGLRCPVPGMGWILLGTLGALVVAPIAIPAVKKAGKAIAKTAVKGGIVAYEGSKELVSEAKAELAASRPEV